MTSRRIFIAMAAILVGLGLLNLKAQDAPATGGLPDDRPENWEESDEIVYARITTSMGNIDLALNETRAPVTVENFFAYAERGYYDYSVVHRVVRGRLIQGGGYSRRLTERPTLDPIENEATNGLDNVTGTIAMARLPEQPHSATGQWYINLRHNEELDHQGTELLMQWGYTVFGRVVAGWDVVQAISEVETEAQGRFEQDVPVEPVVITRVDRIEEAQVGAE